jgi:Ca-activated chloride channel family protein
MLFDDVKPSRLEIAKMTTINFIQKRHNDMIAAIAFAGEARTLAPLTRNHKYIINNIANLSEENTISFGQGTAIGTALSTALLRLSSSDAKTKLIILISDGDNNTGSIDPAEVMEIAKEMRIKVYSIGIGDTNYKYDITEKPNIDFQLLNDISETTGGRFYNSNNNEEMERIFNDIEQLELTKYEEVIKISKEVLGKYLLYATIILLLLYIFLTLSKFKNL